MQRTKELTDFLQTYRAERKAARKDDRPSGQKPGRHSGDRSTETDKVSVFFPAEVERIHAES